MPIKNKQNLSKMSIRLKNIVIKAIKGDTDLRRELKDKLEISEPTLYRYLEDNDDNLTKAIALKVIAKALEMEDTDLLEEVAEVAAVNQTAKN